MEKKIAWETIHDERDEWWEEGTKGFGAFSEAKLLFHSISACVQLSPSKDSLREKAADRNPLILIAFDTSL